MDAEKSCSESRDGVRFKTEKETTAAAQKMGFGRKRKASKGDCVVAGLVCRQFKKKGGDVNEPGQNSRVISKKVSWGGGG